MLPAGPAEAPEPALPLGGELLRLGSAIHGLPEAGVPGELVYEAVAGPGELARVEGPQEHQEMRAEERGVKVLDVGHVHLDAADGQPRVLPECRYEVSLPEVCPADAAGGGPCAEFQGQALIDPGRPQKLEGLSGAAAFGDVGPLQQSHAGIDPGGLRP